MAQNDTKNNVSSINKRSARSVAMGAAFVMAMSAVGPGFLTQTAAFTSQLGPNFGFAILVTILIDIVVQINIWRIITVSGKHAQQIANDIFPGLGYFLTFLIVVGGFFFNIGNVAGAGLGLNVLFGIFGRKRGDYSSAFGNYRVRRSQCASRNGSDSPSLSSC